MLIYYQFKYEFLNILYLYPMKKITPSHVWKTIKNIVIFLSFILFTLLLWFSINEKKNKATHFL
uniref:Uncharacterized protein n=1 Tax=Phyllymenia taiwanensis TaxID=1260292 RepID=R9XWD1_9FLOR|nr:hypothetical protein [Grateloupia taiwanensis]AGO19782.1 hypothetical protein [Grateloupia taiwanensis]